MAMVPDDQLPTAQAEAIPGRAFPRFSDEASPADFGATVGAGIEQAGKEVAQVDQRADQVAIIKANTALKASAQQLQFDPKDGAYAQLGEKAINLPAAYMPKFDQAVSDISGGLANDRQRQAFSQFAAQERVGFNTGLQRHEFDQGQQVQDEVYRAGIAQSQSSGASNYRDHAAVQSERDTQIMLAHGYAQARGLPASVGDEMARESIEKMNREVGINLVNFDPKTAYTELSNPNSTNPDFNTLTGAAREELLERAKTGTAHAEADQIMDAYRSLGPYAGAKALGKVDSMAYPDDMKDEIRASVSRGLSAWSQEGRQTYSKQIIALEEHLSDPKSLTGADRSSVWDLHQKGVFTAAETGEALGRIDRAMRDKESDGASLAWGNNAYQQRQGLDPADKDAQYAMDLVFKDRTQNVKPFSDEWINRGADIISATGVAPSSMVSAIRAQLTTPEADPQSAGQAAIAMRRLTEQSPRGAVYGVDDKLKATARVMSDAIEAGVPAAQAVQLSHKIDTLTDDDKKRLEEEWKDRSKSATGRVKLSSLNVDLARDPRFKTPLFAANLQAPPAMEGEYEQSVHDFFMATGGNFQQAHDLAIDNLKNKWGVSHVNNPKGEIMAYAPEQLHGISTESIRTDLENSLEGNKDVADPKKAQLVYFPGTETSGGAQWHIGVPDQFGFPRGKILEKNGVPLVYTLQSKPEASMDDFNAAQAEAFRRAQDRQAENHKIEHALLAPLMQGRGMRLNSPPPDNEPNE